MDGLGESRDASQNTDLIVLGGGIVGLATAWQFLRRFPAKSVMLIEKEPSLAQHQSGHNSGVLHSGIYYAPDSLKGANCRAGRLAMEKFCQQEEIPYEQCGKVIVAVDESELPRLDKIFERGQANGVACERIDAAQLRELEPHAAGLGAIHVPEAGILDFSLVCQRLAMRIGEQGGTIVTSARAIAMKKHGELATVETTAGSFSAPQIVNCTGLQSDRVARLLGIPPTAQIVPFRGEYFVLRPEARHLVRNMIYPVPDPSLPFLGVHFTRRIDGSVDCGPNAVLAFAREGYTKTSVNLRDLSETLTYGGFLRLAARYWREGAGEMWRSLSKRAFVRALRRLVPEIEPNDLEAAPAGVRAQAVAPDGTMVDDFVLNEAEGVLHVCNAPSPAATASLNIGKMIVDRVGEKCGRGSCFTSP